MAAQVSLRPGDRLSLDALTIESLVIPWLQASMQPGGVPGFVDWRLSGRLSRLMLSGSFEGAEDEALLTTPNGKLPMHRIFLLGLGEAEEKATALKPVLVRHFKRLEAAGVQELALTAPAPLGADGQLAWFETYLLALREAQSSRLKELILLQPGAIQEEAEHRLSAVSRGAGLCWVAGA